MKITEEIAEQVKTLRSTTIDKYGRLMPLKIICKETNLNIATVRFILYEKDNLRVKELRKKWRKLQKEEWYGRPLSTRGLSGIGYPMKRIPFSYPLTRKEFNILIKKQNATCKICSKDFLNGEGRLEKRKTCHIDHDHKSLQVRGIICASCNFGLGAFKDDAKILTNAISYLTQPNSDIINLQKESKYTRLQNVISPLENSWTRR